MPTKDLKGTARGDFDGDGRHDTVIIYDPVGSPEPLLDEEPLAFSDGGPYRMRIEFGAGGTTDEELPDGGTVGSVIDVNGDSRDEVVVDLGGNTGFSVHFATVVACRAVVARGPDGLPAGFGYYGHSMGFPGSVGTHCLDGDGDGRFDRVLQVSSEPVGFPDVNGDGMRTSMDYWEAGSAAVDHFSWERQTYVLEGAEFRLVEDAAGRYERSEGQLELSNDLDLARSRSRRYGSRVSRSSAGKVTGSASTPSAPDADRVERLAETVVQWDAAERPDSQSLTLRAHPASEPIRNTEGLVKIEKRWTTLLIDWPGPG